MSPKDYYRQRHCGIYRIAHKLNGMCYIGQSVDISGRWQQHLTKNKSAIGTAIAAERDSFTFEIIEECSKELLNEREKYYIQVYDCIHPKGYNKNSGGGAWPTVMDEETKKKISAANKGKTVSEETKKKLSKAISKTMTIERRAEISAQHKGKKAPQTAEHTEKIASQHRGMKRSEETKKKQSDAKKAYWAQKKLAQEESDSSIQE